MSKIFYVDGATKHNGQSGKQRSYVCVTDDQGKVISDEFVGDRNNNQTEILAILAALKYISRNQLKDTLIRSDSQLLVRVVNSEWNVQSSNLFDYVIHARNLLKRNKVKLEWIPREDNVAGIYLERKYEKGWREYWPQPQPDYESPLTKKTQNSIRAFVRWINRQNGIVRVDEYRIFTWWIRLCYSDGKIAQVHEALKNVGEVIKFIRSCPMKHYRS